MKIEVFGKEMRQGERDGKPIYTVAIEIAGICVYPSGDKWGATWSTADVTMAAKEANTPQGAARSLELMMRGYAPLMTNMAQRVRSFPMVGEHSLLGVLGHMGACPEALLFVGYSKFTTFEEIYEACTLHRWFSWVCWRLHDQEMTDLAERAWMAAAVGGVERSQESRAADELAYYQWIENREAIKAALLRYADAHMKELT